MAPMLKRNLYVAIASFVVAAVMLAIVVLVKPNGIVHLPLLLSTWVAFAVAVMVSGHLTRAKPDQSVAEDERDKAVTRSVPKYQYMGVFLTVGVYILVLLMLYNSEEKIPLEAFYFMSPSVMLAIAVTGAAGVVIEYWRANSGFVLTPMRRVGIVIAAVVVILVGMKIAFTFGPSDSIGRSCDIEPRFTSTHTEVKVGIPVRFVDTSIGNEIGTANAWYWSFGDGADSWEPNPTHTYSEPGQYTVRLWVNCPLGNSVGVEKGNYMTVLPSGTP